MCEVNMNKINERLIKLRKLNHLTQEELAKKLNISDKVISKWECGESIPQLEFISQLSNLYNISLEYLINGNPSEKDKTILNRKPTTGEYADIFLKQCLDIIKDNKLERYKNILLPQKNIGSAQINYGEHVTSLSGGIFKANKYWEWQNIVTPYIDTDKLIKLDNYEIYEKLKHLPTTYGEVRYLAKIKNDEETLKRMPQNHSSDFYHDRPIQNYTAKQIQGCKDVKFYINLKSKSDCQDCLEEEPLNYALEHLEPTNPNYWEIVEILIKRGAVKLTCEYDSNKERNVYKPDNLTTQLLLQTAIENKKS